MSIRGNLIVIAGPTAIGKTSLAVELAKHYQTEIISADSRQFYREMSIGTAKPNAEEQGGIKHHFIDSLSIHDKYNVGQFESQTISLLEELFQFFPLVIMVGGSGLFIDAVCNGLDEFEDIDESVRELINNQYRKFGIEWLQNELKEKDPEYFEKVDIHNPQRLIRALEVCHATGKPYSSFRKGEKKERPFNIIKILLDDEREKVYERINQRVDVMMEKGLLEEAKELHPYKHLNALNTVGYKELFSYLDGEISLEEAIDKIKQNTRRFAKRQLTWFRNDEDNMVFNPGDKDKIIAFIDMIVSHS